MSLLETSTPDNLIAGNNPEPSNRRVTVLSGQVLARGQVAAIQTSTGKVVAYDSSVAGGHNDARYVMFEDVDASGGDVVGSVYDQGRFNEEALVFVTTGEMTDTVREQLRNYGIYTNFPTTN